MNLPLKTSFLSPVNLLLSKIFSSYMYYGLKNLKINIIIISKHNCVVYNMIRAYSKYFFMFSSHTIQPTIEPYLTLRRKQFDQIKAIKNSQPVHGMFTPDGSTHFANRNPSILMKKFISDPQYKISNIGIGTYKGSLDESDDILQFNSIVDSVLSGLNMIDTCSNFRGGRSEIVVGHALKYLAETKKIGRNLLFVSTKAGYVRQKLDDTLSSQIVNGHCVHPKYLQKSLNSSLQRLNLKTIDLFYLNNFAQSQLQKIGSKSFQQKLKWSFQFCQKARSENKLNFYGLASWQNFRLPKTHPHHLNISKIVEIAERVGGKTHGFKFIQTPINIMMPEAFAEKNDQNISLLEQAQKLKINVVSCSPLLSGTLINIPLPSNKLGCRNNGAKHLQLIRSIPSTALVSTLIGQKTNRHTKKNLQVLSSPLLSQEQWFQIFVPQQEVNQLSQEKA